MPQRNALASALRGEPMGDTPMGLLNEMMNPVRQGAQARGLLGDAIQSLSRNRIARGVGQGALGLAAAVPGVPDDIARAIKGMTRDQYKKILSEIQMWNHPNSRWWGDHSGSRSITGSMAEMMGLDPSQWRYVSPLANEQTEVATSLADAIANGRGAGELLYHGFERGSKSRNFDVGDVVRLPSTSVSSDLPYATAYGVRGPTDPALAVNGWELQTTRPSVFRFEPDTRVAPYSVYDYEDAAEYGRLYDEAITAGEFGVVGVERGKRGVSRAWWDPEVDIYTLRQKKVFDPKSRTYRTP